MDLSGCPVEDSTAMREVRLFRNTFMVNGSAPDSVAQVLDTHKLMLLRDTALLSGDSTLTGYILALQLIYGLDRNNKMKLLYHPLFLQKTDTIPGNTSQVEYTPSGKSYYYIYDKTDFARTTDTSYVSDYRTGIRIRHTGDTAFTAFRSREDVRSITFPFQEIDSVIAENNSKTITLLNAAVIINTGGKACLKQILFLTPDNIRDSTGFIFYKKYGNLAHLCPPNCDKQYFDLK